MKVLVSAVVVLVLMIGAPAVYAETAYQSGFKHGVADANHKDPECAPHQFPCPRPTDYILLLVTSSLTSNFFEGFSIVFAPSTSTAT